MPTDSLPSNPDIERLKEHAKTLRDLVRAGIDGSIKLVRDHHPKLSDIVAGSDGATHFKLADAQLTLARHYGFPSWPKLRAHIDLVNRLSRSPHEQATEADDQSSDDGRADHFLRLACLNYGTDSPTRWLEADRLLADNPAVATHSIFTASAAGHFAAVTTLLTDDPAAAAREGGPFGWVPLLYVTYSRLAGADDADPVAVARVLLEHGADPNSGFLWDGLPSPFTALTGVFGRGEQGAPPHRNELHLARVLLEAGAEANDSQTIYNRGAGDRAQDDTEFLALLLEFGLGRGDGGPWRRALGHEHQSPDEIVAEVLQHAAEFGLEGRARLMLDHGIDPNRASKHPIYQGRTPYEGAVVRGNLQIAQWLAEAGANADRVTSIQRLVGACLSGSRVAVDNIVATNPQLLDVARRQHGDLVARAAELGRAEAIRVCVDLGFDVNASGRATALHEAAFRGDLACVKLLVQLGADVTLTDRQFKATPLGWAQHGGHNDVAEYLQSL